MTQCITNFTNGIYRNKRQKRCISIPQVISLQLKTKKTRQKNGKTCKNRQRKAFNGKHKLRREREKKKFYNKNYPCSAIISRPFCVSTVFFIKLMINFCFCINFMKMENSFVRGKANENEENRANLDKKRHEWDEKSYILSAIDANYICSLRSKTIK